MSTTNYTSPFFGDRDLGNYTPPALDVWHYLDNRNRPEARKVNSDGQIYEADIMVQTTYHRYQGTTSISIENSVRQGTLIGQSDKPCCIFAVPSTYGNHQYTDDNETSEVWAGAVLDFNDIQTYQYFLLSKNNGASFTFNLTNTEKNSSTNRPIYGVTRVDIGTIDGAKRPTTTAPDITVRPAFLNQLTTNSDIMSSAPSKLDYTNYTDRLSYTLEMFNSNSTYGVKWYSVSQSIGMIPDNVIDTIRQKMIEWKNMDDSVFTNIYMVALTGSDPTLLKPFINFSTYSPVTGKYIGTFIATGLPIFTVDSIDQMVRYFQGESWLAENDPPPPSDWSTDWDIYIKGAQKPDIFITMTSDKVDEWLSDLEENQSGLSKGDITVEYQYEIAGSVGDNSLNSGTIKPWVKDKYNDTRETDYMSNLELNYEGNPTFNFGEFADITIDQLYRYYAEMQFRIIYGEYRSAWCRYKIGVIGSPSVPDFDKMNNEGVQDDAMFQDNSTVTLHYDEYPPGYDPYPTPPPPPMPPEDDTSPSPVPPELLGMGLLTETYKVTPTNCAALGRFFWGSGGFLQQLKALNTSPIENVVGLMVMPINIAGTTDVIVVGNVDTNINGDKISSVPLYTLGSVEIKGRYQSFLDYEPYTSIWIFLPFVGFIQLDPVYVTGKTLSVIYSYDIINGLCNAMLFCDGVYVESHQGQCGISVPLIASNRNELSVGIATAIGKTAAGVSNPVNLVDDVAGYLTGFHSTRQGSYSPSCAWTETRNCFLVIETPNASYTGTYKHDKGMPCNASHTIGSLRGFTQCADDIDLSGISGATETEKAMIKDILTTGFFA